MMAASTADGALDEKKAVSAREAECGGVVPTATSGAKSGSVRGDGPGADDAVQSPGEPGPALPFSRARCIALVGTVTGASFLNVGVQCESELLQCAID